MRAMIVMMAVVLGSGDAVLAAGDPPVTSGRRQAASTYASVRPLLTNDAAACPAGQKPVTATITGGGAPGAGSQTMTIAFDKGATVRIGKTWSHDAAGRPSSSVGISCNAGR